MWSMGLKPGWPLPPRPLLLTFAAAAATSSWRSTSPRVIFCRLDRGEEGGEGCAGRGTVPLPASPAPDPPPPAPEPPSDGQRSNRSSQLEGCRSCCPPSCTPSCLISRPSSSWDTRLFSLRREAEEEAADSGSGLSPSSCFCCCTGAGVPPPGTAVTSPLRGLPMGPSERGAGAVGAAVLPLSAHWESSCTRTESESGAPSRMLFRSSEVAASLSSAG